MSIRVDSALSAMFERFQREFAYEVAHGRGPILSAVLPLNEALLHRAEVIKQRDATISRQAAEIAALNSELSLTLGTLESRERNIETLTDVVKGLERQLEEARKNTERLREAALELLSNEEHAVSGGMRNYQKGSPTHKLWKALERAAIDAAKEQP